MKAIALGPTWERGRGWWTDRSRREQLLLAVLAGLAGLALFLVLVVRPLETIRTRAAADIRAADMIGLRLTGAAPAAQSGGTPAAMVARSAAAASVAVQRVEPESGRLRVVLADAPFEAVLRFVADLERTSPLRVGEARIERSGLGAIGVSATFLLTGA